MKNDQKIIKLLNKKPKSLFFWRGYILDWVIDLAIASLIVYIITTFAFQNMYVVGSSMNPTLKHGEMVLVNKFTYIIKKPRRDEIIAFAHTDSNNHEMNIVKRIIGVPGDKIEILNRVVYVNNQAIDQTLTAMGNMTYPITVPDDLYFVLGDNKGSSMDSRYLEIGMIPKNKIEGKIFMRIWPFWKTRFF